MVRLAISVLHFRSTENAWESQLIPGSTNRYWSWWEGVISFTERQENLTDHWTGRNTGDCIISLPHWSERRERITSPINYKIANLNHGASGTLPGNNKKSGIDLLLSKLESDGIKENTLEWFKSYLSGRSQYVACKDSASKLQNFSLEVPQRSILVPTLFNPTYLKRVKIQKFHYMWTPLRCIPVPKTLRWLSTRLTMISNG